MSYRLHNTPLVPPQSLARLAEVIHQPYPFCCITVGDWGKNVLSQVQSELQEQEEWAEMQARYKQGANLIAPASLPLNWLNPNEQLVTVDISFDEKKQSWQLASSSLREYSTDRPRQVLSHADCAATLRQIINQQRNSYAGRAALWQSGQADYVVDYEWVYIVVLADVTNPQERNRLEQVCALLAGIYAWDKLPGLAVPYHPLLLLNAPDTLQFVRAWADYHLAKKLQPVAQLHEIKVFLSNLAVKMAQVYNKSGISTVQQPVIDAFFVDDLRPDNATLNETEKELTATNMLKALIFSPLCRQLGKFNPFAVKTLSQLQGLVTTAEAALDLPESLTINQAQSEKNSGVLPEVQLNLYAIGTAEGRLDNLEALKKLTAVALAEQSNFWLDTTALSPKDLERNGQHLAAQTISWLEEYTCRATNLPFKLPNLQQLNQETIAQNDAPNLWKVQIPGGKDLGQFSFVRGATLDFVTNYKHWATLLAQHAEKLGNLLDPSAEPGVARPNQDILRLKIYRAAQHEGWQFLQNSLKDELSGNQGGLERLRLVLGATQARLHLGREILEEQIALYKGSGLATPRVARAEMLNFGQSAERELADRVAQTPTKGAIFWRVSLTSGMLIPFTGTALALPGWFLPIVGGVIASGTGLIAYNSSLLELLKKRRNLLESLYEAYEERLKQIVYYYMANPVQYLDERLKKLYSHLLKIKEVMSYWQTAGAAIGQQLTRQPSSFRDLSLTPLGLRQIFSLEEEVHNVLQIWRGDFLQNVAPLYENDRLAQALNNFAGQLVFDEKTTTLTQITQELFNFYLNLLFETDRMPNQYGQAVLKRILTMTFSEYLQGLEADTPNIYNLVAQKLERAAQIQTRTYMQLETSRFFVIGQGDLTPIEQAFRQFTNAPITSIDWQFGQSLLAIYVVKVHFDNLARPANLPSLLS